MLQKSLAPLDARLLEGGALDSGQRWLVPALVAAAAASGAVLFWVIGAPRFALLSLMLPPDTTVDDLDGLLDGLLELAGETRLALAGGNVTRSPGPLVVDVTVIGSVKPRKILTRGGAQAGDVLYVTGRIGAAV